MNKRTLLTLGFAAFLFAVRAPFLLAHDMDGMDMGNDSAGSSDSRQLDLRPTSQPSSGSRCGCAAGGPAYAR